MMRALLVIVAAITFCTSAKAQLFDRAAEGYTSICNDGIPPIKPMMSMDCRSGDDYWMPIAKNEADLVYNCSLFDRWGNNVWESNNPEDTFDFTLENGTLLNQGTYFYVINWYCSGDPKDEITQQGFVTLIR